VIAPPAPRGVIEGGWSAEAQYRGHAGAARRVGGALECLSAAPAANERAGEATAQERMPHMFSSQPKHAGYGLMNGVRDIGLGVVGGVAALLAAPVVGAQKEGSAGFVKVLPSRSPPVHC
jgi:hypothetical protein